MARCGLAGLVWFLSASVAFAQEPDAVAGLRLPPPAYPGAVEHLRAGRADSALEMLEREVLAAGDAAPALEHGILRAALLAEAGQPVAAESAWRAVISRAVFMRTYARRAIVESAADRGAPADAETHLAELTRSDPARHRDLVLRVAQAHLDAGAPNRAATHYRQVLGATTAGAAADAARLGLAAALEAAGDGTGALATLRTAQLRHRTADTFVTARREVRRLARARGETAGAVHRGPSTGDWLRRLRKRIPLRTRSGAARTNGPRPSPAAHLENALPSNASRRSTRKGTTWRRSPRARPSTIASLPVRWRPGIRLTDFRLAVRMGDMARARRLGLALWEGRVRGATSEQRRAAGVLLAAVLVATGDVEGGLAIFPGLFGTAPTPDDQRAILWRAGVAAVRTGQYERALTNLRGLIERGPGGNLALAARYWLGVAHEQRGDSRGRGTRLRAARDALPLPLLRA